MIWFQWGLMVMGGLLTTIGISLIAMAVVLAATRVTA